MSHCILVNIELIDVHLADNFFEIHVTNVLLGGG